MRVVDQVEPDRGKVTTGNVQAQRQVELLAHVNPAAPVGGTRPVARAVRNSRNGQAQRARHGSSEQRIMSDTNRTGKSGQKLQLESPAVQKSIGKMQSSLVHQVAIERVLEAGGCPLRMRMGDRPGKIRCMRVRDIGTKTLMGLMKAMETPVVPSCGER